MPITTTITCRVIPEGSARAIALEAGEVDLVWSVDATDCANIAGMDLSALWDLSDFANILMVYCNLPLQYIGFKYVLRAWEHFEKNDGTAFTSKIAGIDVTVWDERAKMK